METQRDDFGIAIRSAFLQKGVRQRFSLFALIIISALTNGLLANSIITAVNPNVTIEVITVMRFFIGDILGSLSVMLAIWVIFTTLVDTRLIISPEKE